MLALVAALALGRTALERPADALTPQRREHVCVSTSVSVKSQYCERGCNAEQPACPIASCLCTALLLDTEQHRRASRRVLLKLAAQLHSISAAERRAAMDAARDTAVRVVQALTAKLSRADGDGPTCTSTQAQISDEWCETNYLSFPLYCECEDGSADSGQSGVDSPKGQPQQQQEAIVKPPVQ